MTPRTRSAVTLGALAVLVGGSGVIGWKALTSPFPAQEELPPCVMTAVGSGEVVFADQVTVSVFNASQRNGLAHSVLSDLTERGFHRGTGGNAAGAVKKGVQIWADDPSNPAVALVAAQFRNPKVVAGDNLGPGVVVVVGTDVALRPATKAPDQMVAEKDAQICVPPNHNELVSG